MHSRPTHKTQPARIKKTQVSWPLDPRERLQWCTRQAWHPDRCRSQPDRAARLPRPPADMSAPGSFCLPPTALDWVDEPPANQLRARSGPVSAPHARGMVARHSGSQQKATRTPQFHPSTKICRPHPPITPPAPFPPPPPQTRTPAHARARMRILAARAQYTHRNLQTYPGSP